MSGLYTINVFYCVDTKVDCCSYQKRWQCFTFIHWDLYQIFDIRTVSVYREYFKLNGLSMSVLKVINISQAMSQLNKNY